VLSLNTMTLEINTQNVYTKLGVAVSVTGIAQVKVQGQNEDMLAAACQQFLGMELDQIDHVAQETLEGHQRAIMGQLTVEEIYKDRKKFSAMVFDVASSDLVNMGMTVISYTIKDIKDEQGYLRALGMARTAQVKCDARIGEAEARKDAGIREARAEEQRMASRFENDISIALSERDFMIKKTSYDREVQTKKALAELAYNLQKAKTQQLIKDETMQIRVIERKQEIKIQDEEMRRREKELSAKVRQPAEAERFRLEKLAEANKVRIILEAEAESEVVRMKGDAEAYAIEAKAKAEAEQMAKKADAWKDYHDAAKIDMVLDTLPKVAAEISNPLSQCKKVTVIASGEDKIGFSKLTEEVLQIMNRLPEMVEKMTGVSVTSSLIDV